ncbi:unnamed protein product, partial [Symbiodinium microadriaticum]
FAKLSEDEESQDMLFSLPRVLKLHHQLFTTSSIDFLRKMCGLADEVYYAPSEIIIIRGESCAVGKTVMYVLLSGLAVVKLTFGEEVATIRPGMMVGEGGALGIADKRTTEICAHKETLVRCIRLQGASIRKAIDAHPEDCEALEETFKKRSQQNAQAEGKRREWLQSLVIPILRQCTLFSGFSMKLILKIAEPLLKSTFPEGKNLCTVGESADTMEDINRIVQRGKADPKKYMRWHTFKVDTPTYFVEKKIEGHYKERATASSKQSQELEVWGGPGDSGMSMNVDHVMLQPQGAADMNSEENQKEAAKVLKKMGFPSLETPANPGTSLPKILSCLDRRLAIISETQTDLDNHKKTLKEKGKLTTTLERMDAKMTELYNAIEQKSNEFEDLRMIRLRFEALVSECQRMIVASWDMETRARKVSVPDWGLGVHCVDAVLMRRRWHRTVLARKSTEEGCMALLQLLRSTCEEQLVAQCVHLQRLVNCHGVKDDGDAQQQSALEAMAQHVVDGAPASSFGRLARGFRADSEASKASVVGASKVSEDNAERDSKRLLKRFGLTLAIPISSIYLDGGIELPWLKTSDWLAYLIRKTPELVCGGYRDVKEAQHMRQEFWRKYRAFQPQHEVYKKSDLKNVIPICVHGDKGRGYGKNPMFCFSFECVFGLPAKLRSAAARSGDKRHVDFGGHLNWSCGQRAVEHHHYKSFNDVSCPKRRKLDCGVQEMPHNGRGHVFLSHFLVGAISHKTMKETPSAVLMFLKEMSRDLGALAREGICVNGETYYIGLTGCKGDCEFHVECGCFERSYLNVGVTRDLPFCPECEGGSPTVPGFEFSDEPKWLQTLYSSEPWSHTPHLNAYVPFSETCRASLYRRDQFHTLKYGFLKDCGASIIIWLCDLAYFDEACAQESLSIDSRLDRAYGLFKLWTIVAKKSTTLRKFTRGTFHRVTTKKFPYLSGKGADVVVVLSWLVWLLQLKLGAPKVRRNASTAESRRSEDNFRFVVVVQRRWRVGGSLRQLELHAWQVSAPDLYEVLAAHGSWSPTDRANPLHGSGRASDLGFGWRGAKPTPRSAVLDTVCCTEIEGNQAEAAEVIGELALMGLFPFRTATVTALKATDTVFVKSWNFQKMLGESAPAQDYIEKLDQEKRAQVIRGVPMAALPVTASPEDVCARAIALHSTRYILAPGEEWKVPPDPPAGAHNWAAGSGLGI